MALSGRVGVRAAGALAAALVVAAPLGAQTPDEGESWLLSVSRYGKWVTLTGAAGFTVLAITRNNDADQIFDGLLTLCLSAPDQCRLTEAGTFLGGDAERLYQETLRLDGQARAWMIAGQVTLLVSGGMFLLDLVSGNEGPPNIPYTPFEVVTEPGRAGFRVRF